MIDNMDELVKEGNKRWKEIESVAEEIRNHLRSGRKLDEARTDRLAHLVLLLIDHLRPMNPSKEQIDEATKGIADLLKSLRR